MTSTGSGLPFSKLCEIGDFAQPELAAVIRDVCSYKLPNFAADFPVGAEHRKDWEVAMAVRALRDFDALRPDSTILGVAAGTEDTIFYLARHVRQVFATDRYLSSGPWQPVAPISMLLDPAAVAPTEFDVDRLVVQHMDGRRLLYPDDTFDGIFSSGSIEHFGDFNDVAAAAHEMGRVLKPGGVLSLSTEFKLAGPPGGIGWPGSTLLFSAEDLQRFIVEASGLELVDELHPGVSDETLSAPRDITRVIDDRRLRQTGGPDAPVSDATTWDDRPHIVLLHDGYVFTSVHLTLRKTERYPWPANEWARPTAAMLEAIASENRQILQRASAAAAPPPSAVAAEAPAGDLVSQERATAERLADAERGSRAAEAEAIALGPLLAEVEAALLDIDTARHGADTSLARITGLATSVERLTQRMGPPPEPVADEGWLCRPVTLARGLEFSVVTDPAVSDPIAWALSAGVTVDEGRVDLMLDLVHPGDHVLDLGAHVGTFSLAAAAAGAKVLALEGSPRNVRLLRESVRRNYFADVSVVHAAVSDEAGTVEFLDDGARGRVSVPGDDGATVGVPAVTLTELLAELRWGPVAFVKMDVEGSEIKAIRGMRYMLEQPDAPALLYESNGHTLAMHGATPEALMSELQSLGYTSYLVEPGRLVRADADHLQPQTILDYLAVKRLPRGLSGWRAEPALTFEERLARLLADATHDNPDHRAYIAAAVARAEDDLLTHSDVRACLDRLAEDADPAVRRAAAWWVADRAGSESR
ncbi:MAG TPA: class I SAM-dependent methyltransferase [Acidimicrobiales bacterium]|nr:class I SAM-dependent methyltransferase [Acidimicrobiales bacterium]